MRSRRKEDASTEPKTSKLPRVDVERARVGIGTWVVLYVGAQRSSRLDFLERSLAAQTRRSVCVSAVYLQRGLFHSVTSEAVEMEGSLDRRLDARHRYVATRSLTPHFASWSYERMCLV